MSIAAFVGNGASPGTGTTTWVSATNPLPVTGMAGGSIPTGATPITATSGNEANTAAVATLAGAAGKTTYITGFQATGLGATAALAVTVTVAGVATTMDYIFLFPLGATVPAQTLSINFGSGIPASAADTAIVVTLPAGGSGNTNAAVSAQGYQL